MALRFIHPASAIAIAASALVVLAVLGLLDRRAAVIVLLASLAAGILLSAISPAWPTRLGVVFIGQSLLVGLGHALLPPPPPGTGPAILLAFGAFVPAAVAGALARWVAIRHLPQADAPPAPIDDRTARIVGTAIALGCVVGAVGLSQQALVLAGSAQPIQAASARVQVDGPGADLPPATVDRVLLAIERSGRGLIDVEITNTSDFTLTLLEIEMVLEDADGIGRGRAYFRLADPILPLPPDGRTQAQLAVPPALDATASRDGIAIRLRSSFARGDR